MRHHSRKKNSTKIFIAITIIAAMSFAASHYFLNQKEKGVVVAKVNDEKIFKSEIEQKLRNIFDGQNQEAKLPDIETLPKEVIEILIKEVYLDKELTKAAKKSKIGKNKEIQDRIASIKDKILRQAYIDSVIKENVTEQRINDKYVELSNELSGKKEYLISHIVVKDRDEAEKILKEIKAKKPLKFSDAAKRYSLDQESAERGGELGYTLEDNIIKEIALVIPTLAKDEISAPIQTKFGWHLIKFSDVRDAKPLPFEEVKENIRRQLTQDAINEINSKIIKDSKTQILIQLKEPEIKSEENKPAEQPAEKTPDQLSENSTEEKSDTKINHSDQQEQSSVEEKTQPLEEKSAKKTHAKSKAKKSKHKKKH